MIMRNIHRKITKRNRFRLTNAYHHPASVRSSLPPGATATYQLPTCSDMLSRQIM